ncbi:MAG: hypothetical protein JSW12_10675 [Deltaproteobacteria bacterium]|nr:MAG: hypothetical protein JSW12_10675 [Deltaproteobacteria bacterium]
MKKRTFRPNAEISNDMKALRRTIWVAIFAVAFAWVESAVVVYLRKIYFDGIFRFPLVIVWEEGKHVIDPLVKIEFGREIATIIMLVAVGWVAGRGKLQKFCFFMIAFGIWDIFYYIWLYIMVGWPESLMTWDLLFYVPLPWVGPVITPVLIAAAMVGAGSLIIHYSEKGYVIRWRWYDMAIELACGLLIIVAFCWDWKNILQVPGDITRSGIPNPFAWWLYVPAFLFSIIYFAIRLKQILSVEAHSKPF